MALDPLELGVIALMVIGVFIWGPEKIPQIAKQVASARKQLDVYTKQLQGVTKEIQTSMTTGNVENLGNVLSSLGAAPAAPASAIPQAPPGSLAAQEAAGTMIPAAAPAPAPRLGQLATPKPTTMSADELLIDMAHKLGIVTQGKTRDELQAEILEKSSLPSDVPPQVTDPVSGDSATLVGADMV